MACNQLKNSFRLKTGEVERENYKIRNVHVFYDFIYRALQTSYAKKQNTSRVR